MTQWTAALNSASIEQIDRAGDGQFCAVGCGSCYRLCSTGYSPNSNNYQGPPGTCIVVKITDTCPGADWCGQTMPWQQCISNPGACRGHTNHLNGQTLGYSAHFDINNQNGQYTRNHWDNVEVTFEPVDCSQWSGPAWDCQNCKSNNSPAPVPAPPAHPRGPPRAPPRGPPRGPALPPVSPANSCSNCQCSWASKLTCVTNDGSLCFRCCCDNIPPAPVPVPPAPVPPAPSRDYQKKWGQCGGVNWRGPTQCEPGSTCHMQNQYYSQCF